MGRTLKKSRLEIEKEKLRVIYEIEKKWAEVWKWVQLQANKDTQLDDVLYTLASYWAQRNHVTNPWGYCTLALERRIRRRGDKQREGKWDEMKSRETGFAEKLAGLIKNIGKPI